MQTALKRCFESWASVFALWEQYRDGAAFDAHAATDHYKRLVLGGLRPLALQRDGEIVFPL
jgi:quinol monooxygenase YgiN